MVIPTQSIPYTLKRSHRRKTIMIRINEASQVDVVAPWSAKLPDIQRFILLKQSWIVKKIQELNILSTQIVPPPSFTHGERLLFLGNRWPLYVEKSSTPAVSLHFKGDQWIVHVPQSLSEKECRAQIKERFMIWYQYQAKEILGSRLFHYSRQMGTEPQKIVIKHQKRLWGSCNYRKKIINMNWQIVMAPVKIIDYVIVHELAHLFFPNHSDRFWSKVREFFPEYKESKHWLKTHQREMILV